MFFEVSADVKTHVERFEYVSTYVYVYVLCVYIYRAARAIPQQSVCIDARLFVVQIHIHVSPNSFVVHLNIQPIADRVAQHLEIIS